MVTYFSTGVRASKGGEIHPLFLTTFFPEKHSFHLKFPLRNLNTLKLLEKMDYWIFFHMTLRTKETVLSRH